MWCKASQRIYYYYWRLYISLSSILWFLLEGLAKVIIASFEFDHSNDKAYGLCIPLQFEIYLQMKH
jgi:hypothetical protein